MNRRLNKLWWVVLKNLRSGELSIDTLERSLLDADAQNMTFEQSLGQRAEALDTIRTRIEEQLHREPEA
jgi:hypothetical protein